MTWLLRGVVACAAGIAVHGAHAQVRCVMPNGVVIEQQLSQTCPSGARKAVTLDGGPANVRPAAGVPPAPVLVDRRLVRTQMVTRAEFGGQWPLTVDAGVLRCMFPVPDRPQLHALLIVVDGATYAINGIAQSHAAKYGWRDVRPIWRENAAIPGTRVAMAPLLARAEKLC